ncbi:unnamed protein product [Ranitomeya imitator]|uniref:Uncharacterized protein n=1 Tax=Ranitomeya imitator TaxID=111125 RepID=A0ABN9LHH2_9NEOB|nr:unnamed protein product [Ranitomeya imitator]
MIVLEIRTVVLHQVHCLLAGHPIRIQLDNATAVPYVSHLAGYDSDVAREKSIDYTTKIYAVSIREMEGTKPHQQIKEASVEERFRYQCNLPKSGDNFGVCEYFDPCSSLILMIMQFLRR